jgi:hypothetical protein
MEETSLLINSTTKFILNNFKNFGKISSKPFIVAINGPQGSGNKINKKKY